jgi:hypothetical protein
MICFTALLEIKINKIFRASNQAADSMRFHGLNSIDTYFWISDILLLSLYDHLVKILLVDHVRDFILFNLSYSKIKKKKNCEEQVAFSS